MWSSCPKCSKPVHFYGEGPEIPEGEAVRTRIYGPCNCGWSARTQERAEEIPEEAPAPGAVEGAK